MRTLGAFVLLASMSAGAASAAVVGPSSYTSVGDSPFAAQSFSTFVLEDFDGAPKAGYTRSASLVLGSGPLTDSVGGTGGSLYVVGATSLTLDFSDYLVANGVLPNRAGIVWTDVGVQFGECCGAFSGVGEVRFEAFDGSNVSLGLIAAVLGDGSFDGGTSEDRFFGASNAGGISRLVISMPTSEDWEVDHLQFGTAVPEPGTWALLIAGFGLVGVVMRRRTRGVAA